MTSEFKSHRVRIDILVLIVVFAAGIFLRLPWEAFSVGAAMNSLAPFHPQPAYDELGMDEGLYRDYLNALSNDGLSSYPELVEAYILAQKERTGSILPPVRFLYIFAAYEWHSIFGVESLQALRQTASFFNILTLALASLFAWRLRGPTWGLAVAALMAFAPTQLHMSQHALIDGFFTFWALLVLWLLWENLRAPRDWRWLLGYVIALTLLVLTKENSFFVWVGVVALIVVNHWFRFGTVTRELVIATGLGPVLGIVVLGILAGGLDVLLETYQLSVSKNFALEYAILTGDGPWYRYLVDLLLVSPIILMLTVATIFRLDRTMKPELFFAVFIAASYVVMCNVKYGMNLRYAIMWDMPLRFLAFSQITAISASAKRFRPGIAAAAVALIAALELRQYGILAIRFPLYELITEHLVRALHILKGG